MHEASIYRSALAFTLDLQYPAHPLGVDEPILELNAEPLSAVRPIEVDAITSAE
jgi:hypothetical protein